MIQTVPCISHQKKQNGQNGLKHYLHLNLTRHVMRYFIPSISTLVRFGIEETIST